MTKLPFPDDTLDVVDSTWVVEVTKCCPIVDDFLPCRDPLPCDLRRRAVDEAEEAAARIVDTCPN